MCTEDAIMRRWYSLQLPCAKGGRHILSPSAAQLDISLRPNGVHGCGTRIAYTLDSTDLQFTCTYSDSNANKKMLNTN